ncbi:hypothetical protein OAM01_00850 [bacterium]|nr:hypothetical protein [bacterium]
MASYRENVSASYSPDFTRTERLWKNLKDYQMAGFITNGGEHPKDKLDVSIK